MENIENILKNIDGDWLTGILEPHAEEFLDEIILLDITKKDLSNKNYDNIQQVGYRAPYGDEGEIKGLIYFYYKKCIEWYDRDYYSFGTGGLNLPDAAEEESRLIIKDEKDTENTSLALLYCEGTYVWAVGG